MHRFFFLFEVRETKTFPAATLKGHDESERQQTERILEFAEPTKKLPPTPKRSVARRRQRKSNGALKTP